jgi:hypothetical protein
MKKFFGQTIFMSYPWLFPCFPWLIDLFSLPLPDEEYRNKGG